MDRDGVGVGVGIGIETETETETEIEGGWGVRMRGSRREGGNQMGMLVTVCSHSPVHMPTGFWGPWAIILCFIASTGAHEEATLHTPFSANNPLESHSAFTPPPHPQGCSLLVSSHLSPLLLFLNYSSLLANTQQTSVEHLVCT